MPHPIPFSALRKALGPLLLAVATGLCLLPFLALCWYAHPSADDFLQATDVYKYGRWGYMPHMYLTWTGRYTSVVLWALLNPVQYGGNITGGYGAICLLLLALPVALVVLLRTLLAGQFRRRTLWLASGVLTSLLLWQLPSPAEAFYWIVSGYNYLLPALLTLLWLAVLVRHAQAGEPAEKRKWLALAGGLAVLIIGGNETNAVPLAVGVTGFTALRTLQQRRLPWDYVWLSAVVAVACAAAFLAPGNFARLGPANKYSVLESLDKGALSAYRLVCNWLGNGVLPALTLLLLPVSFRLRRVAGLPLNRLAQNPGFITLLMAVSLVLVAFMGWRFNSQPLPFRTRNILYLFFLIGWFLNAHAWAQYLWRRTARTTFALPLVVRASLVIWIIAAFSGGHLLTLRGHETTDNYNNVLLAYEDWLGGAAARYDAQLTARYHALQTPGWLPAEAVVEPLQDPPYTLLFGDITPNIYDWSNQAYAEFFGRKTIRIN
ncbi:DUF6056 family protein [Hymenobacter psychrotolerans]|uniref:4-amino-4-deoxy-L-arabinose transferase n=1 Tax=Hymenobacter psychrotolerans DSM 18569 TaxID=1121959 RepID=A0A1M7AB82_9BACT|nr:DUF6056 family protein [Hymenobacter psychrotolerans]SHL39906.1 hypothetical protein SAMN02746009_02667 [Hymenobacter psychrotolerans DSM 18569]